MGGLLHSRHISIVLRARLPVGGIAVSATPTAVRAEHSYSISNKLTIFKSFGLYSLETFENGIRLFLHCAEDLLVAEDLFHVELGAVAGGGLLQPFQHIIQAFQHVAKSCLYFHFLVLEFLLHWFCLESQQLIKDITFTACKTPLECQGRFSQHTDRFVSLLQYAAELLAFLFRADIRWFSLLCEVFIPAEHGFEAVLDLGSKLLNQATSIIPDLLLLLGQFLEFVPQQVSFD